MRPGPSLLLAVLSVAAVPAFAQQPGEASATVEQAIARAVADSMPDLRYPWALDWSAFGVRGGRDVFWHLAPPVPYQPHPLPSGVHRRTGWLNVRGASGGVDVCGDVERIGALSFEITDLWLGQSDVIEELASRGVTSALMESHEAVPPPLGSDDGGSDTHYRMLLSRYPAFRQWRLERPGHEPVTISAAHRCTPPGTRSATRCSMNWTVLFRPDERLPGADLCFAPTREHVSLD